MATYVPAKYGTEYIIYVGLESVATAGAFQANPTLTSGDFKISKDGGSLSNLTTLPTVTPTSGKMVKITLSATEMQCDNATVVCSDASGGEWKDLIINIPTAARQIDDLAYPTTSGRSIDVTTTGEVGIDWANIGSPTTSVNLSGTTVKTATDVETDTQDIQTRLPAALVGGRIDSNVGAISSDATAADNLESALDGTGGVTITAALTGNVTGNLSGSVGSVTGNVGGNVAGSVGSVVGAVGSVTGNVGGSVASVTAGVTVTTNNDKTGYGLSSAAVQAIWDAATSALTTVGSIGKWIVDKLDVVVSTRLASGSYTAPDNSTVSAINTKLGTPAGASVSADVAAIKADTGNIGTAGAGLTAVASAANLATLTGYVDTEVAAIKAKTDNLPASPANEATLTTIAGYLDTEIAAILAAVDTEVASIKTVTDALPNGGALTTITNNVAAILDDTGTSGVVIADGGITATKIATGAIDADAVSADAVAEIQSGLATSSVLSTVATNVSSILADTGTDGVVLSTAQMQALADIVLGRSVSNIDSTAATHSLYELIQAILESNASTGSWVIYKTNGSTTFNTRTLATDPDALPIVGVS